MAQYYTTRFATSDFLEIALQVMANATKTRGVQSVALVLVDQLVPDLDGTFSDDDDTEGPSPRLARAR